MLYNIVVTINFKTLQGRKSVKTKKYYLIAQDIASKKDVLLTTIKVTTYKEACIEASNLKALCEGQRLIIVDRKGFYRYYSHLIEE